MTDLQRANMHIERAMVLLSRLREMRAAGTAV